MTPIELVPDAPVLLRAADPEISALRALLFRRYPHDEWATFARFGWRDTPAGLVVTLAALDTPRPNDLDEEAAHVVIREPYTLRVALGAERHPLAVGVIHSHPEGSRTYPSFIDDDMDAYYADYISGFAPDRPYVSLIFAERDSALAASGRVYWRGRWRPVNRFAIERTAVTCDQQWAGRLLTQDRPKPARHSRVERLAAALGTEAADRLARATVAVVGAGGTGSPALEVLARAGVGHIIVVDPDHFTASNLERVHGSFGADVTTAPAKVTIAKRHILSINPLCRVTAIRGALPQEEVIDVLVGADVVIGATDQQHSRLALSDLAVRYLVPVLDCGVTLEGTRGKVTGQVIQIVRFLAADPCALCRDMIVPWRVAQELMSDEERAQRRASALAAARDETAADAGTAAAAGYWRDMPQLNTVGYLTTTAGAMTAGYAIGWITGRFDPPFERLQLNLSAPLLETADIPTPPRARCSCRRVQGYADQARADQLISAPLHWPRAVEVQ